MSGAGILLYDPQLKVVLLYQDKEHSRKFHLSKLRDEMTTTFNDQKLQIAYNYFFQNHHLKTPMPKQLESFIFPLLEDIGGKMKPGENPVHCALTEAIQESNNYLDGKISEDNLSDQYSVEHRGYTCYVVKVKGFELAMAKQCLKQHIDAPGYNEMNEVVPVPLSSIKDGKEDIVVNGEKYLVIMDSSGHRPLFIYPRTLAILRQCFQHNLFESITKDNKIPPVVLSHTNKSSRSKRVRFKTTSRRMATPEVQVVSTPDPSPEWISSSTRKREKNGIQESFFVLFSAIAVIAGATVIIIQQT